MTHGNHFSSPSSSSNDPVRLQQEIAELKEVIGKLWKAVDAFKISSAQAEQQTQDQIDSWKQTNLQLMELLTAKFHETERLTQNYSRLTSYLDKWDRRSQASEQAIEKLNAFSTRPSYNSLTGADTSKIEQNFSSLDYSVKKLKEEIKVLNNSSNTYRTWNVSLRVATVILVGMLCTLATFNFRELKGALVYLQQRSEWTLIKLQRMEQAR